MSAVKQNRFERENRQSRKRIFSLNILVLTLLTLISIMTVLAAGSPWGDYSWAYRQEITLKNSGNTSLTDFPAYLKVNYISKMKSDYGDIRFFAGNCTNHTSTNIAYELESYNTTKADFWVRVPSLKTNTTKLCMYYGNPYVTTTQNKTAVWDTKHVAVWHMSENYLSTQNDSTKYKTNLVPQYYDSNNDIQGVVGMGENYPNGFSRGINASTNRMPGMRTSQTLESWAYYSANPAGNRNIFILLNMGAGAATQLGFRGGNTLAWYWGGNPIVQSAGLPSINTWHYYTYSFNGTASKLYIDGLLKANTTTLPQNAATTEVDVNTANWGETFYGRVDEVRVSNITRTADWIKNNYQFIANQTNKVTFGTQQNSTKIIFTFVNPTLGNNSKTPYNWVFVNVTTSISLRNNATIWFNGTNYTMKRLGSAINKTFYFNKTGLFAGTYNYKIYGTSQYSTEVSPLMRIFVGIPYLKLYLPWANQLFRTQTNQKLNFSVSGLNIDKCWYTLNGSSTKNMLAQCKNTTLNLGEGRYTLRLFANNTVGLTTNVSQFFLVNFIPKIQFVNPTLANGTISRVLTSTPINVSITESTNSSTYLDLNKKLIGYWNFEKLSGTTVYDNSSYKTIMTLVNSAKNVTNSSISVRGSFGSFNGVNQYMSTASNQNLTLSSNTFTESAWIYSQNPGDATYHGIMGFSANTYPALAIYDGNTLYGGFVDNASNWRTFTYVGIQQNKWTHVVQRFNGTHYDCFVNGVKVYTSNAYSGSKLLQTVYQLYVGRWQGYYFKGYIDEPMIFNRGISDAEIKALYNSKVNKIDLKIFGPTKYSTYKACIIDADGGQNCTTQQGSGFGQLPQIQFVNPTYANNAIIKNSTTFPINISVTTNQNSSTYIDFTKTLLGYWNFEKVSGVTTYDNSTYTNTATLQNGATQITDLALGIRGKSISLNGVNQYVSVPSSNSLKLTSGTYTESAWVYSKSIADNAYHTILGYDPGSVNQRYPGMWIYNGSGINFGLSNGTSWFSYTVARVFSPNSWNHVLSRYNGTDLDLFVNGKKVFTTPLITKPYLSTSQLNIGLTNALYFKGYIDEVFVFNRALKDTEVSALYNTKYTKLDLTFYNMIGDFSYKGCVNTELGDWNCTPTRNISMFRYVNTSTTLKKELKNINTNLFTVTLNIKNNVNKTKTIKVYDYVTNTTIAGSFSPIPTTNTTITGPMYVGKMYSWNITIQGLKSQNITYAITGMNDYYTERNIIAGLD